MKSLKIEVVKINVIKFNVIKIVTKGLGVSVNSQFERNSLVRGSSGTYPLGWVGGWLVGWTKWKLKVEVEVEAELGKTEKNRIGMCMYTLIFCKGTFYKNHEAIEHTEINLNMIRISLRLAWKLLILTTTKKRATLHNQKTKL